MIYAAEIVNGTVDRVLVVRSMAFVAELGGTWVQTFKNGTRGQFAGTGFSYDPVLDVFIPPQPYQSWTLDPLTFEWVPPVPMPPGGPWIWDEEHEEWVEA